MLTVNLAYGKYPLQNKHHSKMSKNPKEETIVSVHYDDLSSMETNASNSTAGSRSVHQPSVLQRPAAAILQVTSKDRLFRDGKRQIDMILVYKMEIENEQMEKEKKYQRGKFEEFLEHELLELERDEQSNIFGDQIKIVKVHIPPKTLKYYAELKKITPPVFKMYEQSMIDADTDLMNYLRKYLKQDIIVHTSAQRSQIVWEILMRVPSYVTDKVGIKWLMASGIYSDVFPLHEGRYNCDNPDGTRSMRRMLYMDWAQFSCWRKTQPLWHIKHYFGDKIGLYFAWLGFYTYMLILPSLVGVLCLLYGLISMGFDSPDYKPAKEICNVTGVGATTLCPLCDDICNFVMLKESCTFAKLTYLFDNPATVAFSIFMAFWATTFLEMWKRYQAVLVWEWDLLVADDDEEVRPEFEQTVTRKRINPVTNREEPYLSLWSKAWRLCTTTSMVFFMLFVVVAAILGTSIYRISVVSVLYSSEDTYIRQHAQVMTSITAAIINLIVIMTLTKLYRCLAVWLTDLENPRMQTDYEDSFTFKIFVFQFINYYSSLIYIAFFKGRFFTYPGDKDLRRSFLTILRIDVCDPTGCLTELFIQLAIIMVGKQLFNNILEFLIPIIKNWWRKWKNPKVLTHRTRSIQWESDYELQDAKTLPLFEEYLEMVIQYGFVTLFVASFPLAPLFALLNNIVEIRLDAFKLVTQTRRPLAERVKDIGAWYGILQGITYISVVTNAFVIAYTSEFIPRLVYKFDYSENHDLVGYIQYSLSEFNTSDYKAELRPHVETGIIPNRCYYRGFRNGPAHENSYELSNDFWYINGLRLAFVVIFEHIVFALTGILAYAIPDVPSDVNILMQREKLIADEDKFARKQVQGESISGVSVKTNVSSRTQGSSGSQSVKSVKLADEGNKSGPKQESSASKSNKSMRAVGMLSRFIPKQLTRGSKRVPSAKVTGVDDSERAYS